MRMSSKQFATLAVFFLLRGRASICSDCKAVVSAILRGLPRLEVFFASVRLCALKVPASAAVSLQGCKQTALVPPVESDREG